MKRQTEVWSVEESQENIHDMANDAGGMANRRSHLMAKGTGERPPAKSMVLPTNVSIWEPPMEAPSKTPSTSELLQKARETTRIAPEIERSLVELLTRPIDQSGGHSAGYARREEEIGQMFASLELKAALAVAKRLDLAKYDDPLATAFNRMVASRRNRLRAFLGDARRRACV
ncbi:MAG TPA: hypothetical protein VFG30_38350 [Polyangiales bacterium]|nr:hypothetical protein [Polyangiales bacterium]